MRKRRSDKNGRKTRSDSLSDKEIKLVDDFLKIDDFSRMCPGKKKILYQWEFPKEES